MDDPAPLLAEEREGDASMGREWRIQRVGWVVMAAIVLLALAGVFGTGPLSWASTSADDSSLTIEYPRFARNGAPLALHLQVAASAATDGQVHVLLGSDLLGSLQVRQIIPQPASQVASAEGVVLAFELEGEVPLEVTISAVGDAIGLRDAAIGLEGERPLDFWQLYYP